MTAFTKLAALIDNIELKPYQQRAIDKIKDRKALVVAHGTGTGKTLTGIAGFEMLKAQGEAEKALVVVPASLRTNFAEHGVKKFTDSTVQVVNKGADTIDPDVDYLVVSNNLYAINPSKYQEGRDTLIVDEAHNARTRGTGLERELRNNASSFANRVALTASPINNRPNDLVTLLNFAKGEQAYNPLIFDAKYVKEIRSKKGLEREEFKPDKQLKEDLRTLFDYERGNEDLPKVREELVKIPMDAQQLKAYKYVWNQLPPALKKTIKNDILPDKRNSVSFFGALSNARVASNNPRAILKDNNLKPTTKVRLLLEDIKDKNTMVYSNYDQHGVGMIKDELARKGLTAASITGSMTSKQKDEQIERFKSGLEKTFLTTPTGKEGISLPNVEKEIIFDPHWNPEVTRQAVGRGVRADSLAEEILIRHYLAVEGKSKTPSVEEWIYSVAQRKKDLQKQVLKHMQGV